MKIARPLFKLSLLTLLVSASSVSFASAFSLGEQNAVQTGDFGSGGAAIAEDASTAWFNPAGLVRVDKPQIVLAGNEIWFGTKFSGTVTQSILDPILGFPASQSVSNVSGGTSNFLPTFHASYPINPNLVAGFSVTTPFGLSTDYNTDTFVRYAATKTQLKTIDISPSFGIKINPTVSWGFGLDEQRLLATFDSYAGLPALVQPANAYDTLSHSAASDWATGWHSGVLYQPNSATRFGLSYHSKYSHHVSGYSQLSGILADPDFQNPDANYATNNATANVYLPASTTLSAYHDVNNRWAVMGTVIYTQWDIFKNLVFNNIADSAAVPITVVTPENFKNSWRVSAGSNYKINDQWLVRGGLGFDQNPTNNIDRNIRLPDGNRYAVAIGGRYQATKNLALDAGWTHEFIQTSGINNTSIAGAQVTTVSGSSANHADVLGLQMTYSFS